MKIFYLIDSFAVGGAENSLLELIRFLPDAETVVCGIYKEASLKEKFIGEATAVYHLNLSGKYEWRNAFEKLSTIIEAEKPDLIHAVLFRSCILSRFLSKKFRLPLVNSLVSDSYGHQRFSALSFSRALKLKTTLWLDRFTANRVNRFIANSNAVKESYAKVANVNRQTISVIFRGRSLHTYSKNNNGQPDLLKATLGLNGHFVFLIVGRLIETKRHLDLIEAFSVVQSQFPDTKLLIVGEGSYRNQIEAKIADLNLSEKIILTGRRDDVPAILQLADVFVFPTSLEGLPGVLIEAAFAKLPIIASDIKPNLEIITNQTGSIFPLGDVNALTRLMTESINDYPEVKQRAELAFKQAVEKFEISCVANQHLQCYQTMLNSK